MAITDEIRKAFDDCTVMAGVENDFECVYVTKAAALLYLNEIDAVFRELLEENERFIIKLNAEHIARQNVESENAKLRELVRNLLRVILRDVSGVVIGAHGEHPTYYSFADAMRELGIEVDDGI